MLTIRRSLPSTERQRRHVLALVLLLLLVATGICVQESRKFYIKDDKFWKDENPFQIIGGVLHYFRVLPEYWEDRLVRAKALGLNTIQVYVPWNLHEPKRGEIVFEGIADLVSFLKLCQKLDFLVMLRVGP